MHEEISALILQINARRLIRRVEAVKDKLPALTGKIPAKDIAALRAETDAMIARLRATTGDDWVDLLKRS